jgi:hypothetical protein
MNCPNLYFTPANHITVLLQEWAMLVQTVQSETMQTVYHDDILDQADLERAIRILRSEFHLNGTVHVEISRETAKGKQLRNGG